MTLLGIVAVILLIGWWWDDRDDGPDDRPPSGPFYGSYNHNPGGGPGSLYGR